jgi:hypothetical protein
MMLDIHSIFRNAPPAGAKLWRYLSFAKFVSLLQTACLHFTRADQFDDHFEGAWPKSDRDYWQEIKSSNVVAFTKMMKQHSVAVSCWVELPHESAAMWRLYAAGSEGVAVTTTFEKLSNVIGKINEADEVGLAGVGRVRYFDHLKDGLIAPLAPNGRLPNTLTPFMLKNLSYEHEKEVRGIIVAQHGAAAVAKSGLEIPIDLVGFVDDVVVNPFCDKWLVDAASGLCERYGIARKLRKSSLSPDVFDVADDRTK